MYGVCVGCVMRGECVVYMCDWCVCVLGVYVGVCMWGECVYVG